MYGSDTDVTASFVKPGMIGELRITVGGPDRGVGFD